MRCLQIFSLLVAVSGLAMASGCDRASTHTPPANVAIVKEIRAGAATGGGDAETATAPTGTGWGNLKGTFVYQGDPPSLGNLATGGKDGQVCDAHPIPNQTLVIDPETKGIANVVVYARKVSRVDESYAATAEQEAVFDQKDCIFLSHVMGLRTSQPMRIKNSDPITHNTNFTPPLDSGFNQSIAGDDSAVYKFQRAQNDPVMVVCNIHNWMKSYVIPRSDPYFAVSDAKGQFKIDKLPAGEKIEFQVWHEAVPGPLVAKPDWAKGRFTLTIPADGEQDLGTIEVPPAALKQ